MSRKRVTNRYGSPRSCNQAARRIFNATAIDLQRAASRSPLPLDER
jgi:hypothetical protein